MKSEGPAKVNGVLKRSVVCALLLLLPAFALAAEPGNPAIRAAVEKFIAAQDISGAVTVVAAKDKFLALDTIGLADIAKKLEAVSGIAVIRMTDRDIVRHPLVASMLGVL